MDKKSYALITGASKGFGRALAFDCARRQINLVLVSLPEEGLHELATELKQAYTIDVIAIEKDLFSDGSCPELFNEIKKSGVKVNMLINNAGVGSTELFKDGYYANYEKQIRLNVLATTLLTHLFVDMLRQNSPSYILNVGSLASFFSLAKKQVYGATKSYINYFSKSLRRELKQEKIFVSVVCPGGMYTNDSSSETIRTGNLISRASGMHPEKVAPIAIDGLLRKKEIIVPGKINRTIFFLNKILPRFIVRFFEVRTMRRLYNPCIQVKHQSSTPVAAYSEIYSK